MSDREVAMLIVDVIAVVALVVAFVSGAVRGFFASLGTIVGLIAGAFAAVWLVPLAVPLITALVPAGFWRTAALAALAIGTVVAVTALGTGIGAAVRRRIDRTRLRGIERFFGGIVTTAATGLVLLALATGLTSAGIPVVSTAVATSTVIRALDALTPSAIDQAITAVRGVVVADTLPRLTEVLDESVATPTASPIALDDPEVQQASESVVRISGTAYACGVTMTGSGFVVADDLVVTNAHVVAGVSTPLVEMAGVTDGEVREGRIVYLDPVDDLAIISIEGSDAEPLEIADPVDAGERAVVLGYPLGGPLTSSTATVLSVGSVPVADIYETSLSSREIYALAADVQPGNSGGPLVDGDGRVVGVVFARGADGEDLGYAMTTDELTPVLAEVSPDDPTVSSGQCTS
ncbi:MAG: MarP family serine protease [Microbacterium sp.]